MKSLQGLEQFKAQLSEKLSRADFIEIAHQMGYRNIDQFEFRLNKLLNEPYLGLSEGYYDFKMDALTFIHKLCDQLDLDAVKAGNLAMCIQDKLAAYEEFRPYVLVETDFDIDTNTSPLLALTFMEPKRQLKVTLGEFCTECDEMIEVIREKILAHYQVREGEIEHWGKIKSYIYFHNAQTQVRFDCRGKVIANP